MALKSDKRPRVISATEASRTFSAILDRIERGGELVVERQGRRVCLMTRAPAEGRRGSECLTRLQGRALVLLDDRFGEDLLEVIVGEPMDRRPWES
jgi:antitoxin (DNA-binding transcriptional repressor) of toxin-antitoxin stability system